MKTTLFILFFVFSPTAYTKTVCEENLTQIQNFLEDRVSFLPSINYSCLNERDYGRNALNLFNRSSDDLFSELYDLEERAKKFRAQVSVEIFDLERSITEQRMNGTLTNRDRQEYAQQMANLSQTIAVETRIIQNMTGNIRATGALLERFIPFLMKNSRLTLLNTYGFESLDEIYDSRDFMIKYGKDVRDAPIEIEAALHHTNQLNNRLQQLYQLLGA